MNKTRCFAIGIMAIIIFAVMTGWAYAVEQYNIKMDITKENVTGGDTVVVNIGITDIAVDDGLGTLCGKLEYDKNIFESVDENSFKVNDGWDNVIYNSKNGIFVTITSSGENIKEEKNILSIEFKVLDNAKSGNTTIKISNISSSDGNIDIETSDIEKTIQIINNKEENNLTSVWIMVAVAALAIGIVIVIIRKK